MNGNGNHIYNIPVVMSRTSTSYSTWMPSESANQQMTILPENKTIRVNRSSGDVSKYKPKLSRSAAKIVKDQGGDVTQMKDHFGVTPRPPSQMPAVDVYPYPIPGMVRSPSIPYSGSNTHDYGHGIGTSNGTYHYTGFR